MAIKLAVHLQYQISVFRLTYLPQLGRNAHGEILQALG